MRYTDRLRKEAIAQWRSCYINYEHLKVNVKIIRDSVRERLQLQDLINFGTHLQARTQKTISLKNIEAESPKMPEIQMNHNYFVKASNDAHHEFIQCWNKNTQVYGDFVKWKHKQIQTNFHACWKANFMMQQKDVVIKRKLIKYVQYIFVQSLYLTRMIQTNTETQRRILARHKLYSTNVFPTPASCVQNFVSIDQSHILRRQIERFYFRISSKPKDQNRYKLRKLAEQEHVQVKESLVIGLLIGALITVIIFISIILARANVTLQSNTVFNKDFTLWRGIAIFIFYIWVLGADFSYFEKYKVSLRIILRNNYPEYTISSDLFKIAGVFSIIFIIVFTIYSLQIAGIIQIGSIEPQWLPLFVWAPFLLFLFNPFPILYPYGRLFFFKKIFYAITSVIFVVDFPKVWVTAQAISLLNVFQDFFYAICFYTNLKFPYDSTVNVCRTPAINARFAYTIVIYSIRIIQCIKVGCGQGSQLKKSQFLNSIKFSLSMLTAILAYVWKQVNNPYVFPAWLTFAIISTLASFVWDYKIGWDLDFTNKKNRFLRDELIYPRRNYYIWLVINFFFRFAWTLNISPNVIREYMGGSPQIITMSFAFVQLIRRGFWNLVRIQVDQIRNNMALQALSKEKQKKQKQIYKFIEQNKSRINSQSMQNLVETEKTMIEVQNKQNESIGKQKKKIIQKVKEFKIFCEQQRKHSQQKKSQIKPKIEFLLKHIY